MVENQDTKSLITEKSPTTETVEQTSQYQTRGEYGKQTQPEHTPQSSLYKSCLNSVSKVLHWMGYKRIPQPWRSLEHCSTAFNVTMLGLYQTPLKELFTDLSKRVQAPISNDEQNPEISKSCPISMLQPLPNLHFACFETGGGRKYLEKEREWLVRRQGMILFLIDGNDTDCIIEAREEMMMAAYAAGRDVGGVSRVPRLVFVVNGNRDKVVERFDYPNGRSHSRSVYETRICDIDLADSSSLDRAWQVLLEVLQQWDKDKTNSDEKHTTR